MKDDYYVFPKLLVLNALGLCYPQRCD